MGEEIEEIESVGGAEKTGKAAKKGMGEDMAAPEAQFETMVEGTKEVDPAKFEKVDGKWVDKASAEALKSEAIPQRVTATDSTSIVENIGALKSEVKEVAMLTPADMQARSKELVGRLEALKEQLATSKADLKPSYHKVLENRLTHIDDNLKVAITKAGGEYEPTEKAAKGSNPAERFIDMLTDGQRQLEHLDVTIEQLQITGKNLNPASMLALQVKVGQIQQQIELFASLLSKALESTKSIMNVQV